MSQTRSRDEVLESLQVNARGLTEDLGGLGHSLQQAASPKAWVRNNPATALLVGAAVVGTGIFVIYAGRSRILRLVLGGVASAVGSVVAAQASRWVKVRLSEKLRQAEDEMPPGLEYGGETM